MAHPSKPTSNRILGADGVRALAALWVFFHHVIDNAGLKPENPLLQIVHNGSLGVPIFFVLSGMLLARPFWQAYLTDQPMPSLRVYTQRRLARIVPGYLVCLLVVYAVYHGVSGDGLPALVAGALFVNSWHWATFFPVRGDPPLWTIGVEMMFYVMLPMLMAVIFALRKKISGVALCVAAMGGIVAIQFAITSHVVATQVTGVAPVDQERLQLAADWITHRHPVSLFAHFIFGILAARWMLHFEQRATNESPPAIGDAAIASHAVGAAQGAIARRSLFNRYDALVALTAIALIIESTPSLLQSLPGLWKVGSLITQARLGLIPYHWPTFPMLVMVILALLPQTASLGRWLDSRFMRFTATVSFGIYIWHFPLQMGLLAAWPQCKETAEGLLLFAAASLALSYAVASLSWYVIEQPVLKLAHRSRGKKQGRVG